MELYHITESKNLSSIRKHGLIPKVPYLKHHADYFKRPVIYTIQESDKMDKYIRDFVYFQLWGKPRNLILDKLYKTEGYPSKWEELPDYVKNNKIELKQFSILKLYVNVKDIYMRCTHIQNSEMTLFEDIKEEYSHDDKEICTLSEVVSGDNIRDMGICYPIIRNNDIKDVVVKI